MTRDGGLNIRRSCWMDCDKGSGDNWNIEIDEKSNIWRCDMHDRYVTNCPFCGGTEVIESFQDGYGAVTAVSNKWGGVRLYHSVCRNCGSVVRSYVKEPGKLLKRKDRK